MAVRINGENAPLRTKLRSGDYVEIITAPHAKPNPAWLAYVVTGKARSHIRHFLKTVQYDELAKLGERLLNQALSSLKIDPTSISDFQWQKLARDSGAKSKKELLADMVLGKHLPAVLSKRLLSPRNVASKANGMSEAITIMGTEGMAVQFSKCCRPIPGDLIVGFIKKDQGLVIHVRDCSVIGKMHGNPDNWLDVTWDKNISKLFEVSIKMVAENQRGVLAKVAAEIAKAGSNIDNVTVEGEGAYTAMHFILQVSNRSHLAQVMRGVRRIREIIRINREKS